MLLRFSGTRYALASGVTVCLAGDVKTSKRLYRQVFLLHENTKEDLLDRAALGSSQFRPSGRGVKAPACGHKLRFELSPIAFLFGPDLPTASAEAIEGNAAQSCLVRGPIEQLQLVSIQNRTQVEPARNP